MPAAGELPETCLAAPAAALLEYLRRAGYAVALGRAEGTLTVSPRDRLTPAECEQVRALKPELLRLLGEERTAARMAANAAALERLTPCRRCRALVDPQAGADVRTCCPKRDCPWR